MHTVPADTPGAGGRPRGGGWGARPDVASTEHALSRGPARGLGLGAHPYRPAEGEETGSLSWRHYGEVPGAKLFPGGEAGVTRTRRFGASQGPGPPAISPTPYWFTGHSPRRGGQWPGATPGQGLPPARRVTSGTSIGDLPGALCLSGPQFTPLSKRMDEMKDCLNT